MAVNGAEAVEAYRSVDYDVIVMDLHMPVMNGDEAFREIRRIAADERRPMPAVVFYTAYNPSRELWADIASDPRHCILTKPLRNEQLLQQLRSRL